jgi:hypothetical protein
VAQFAPESLAQFAPDLVAQFDRNIQFDLNSRILFSKIMPVISIGYDLITYLNFNDFLCIKDSYIPEFCNKLVFVCSLFLPD